LGGQSSKIDLTSPVTISQPLDWYLGQFDGTPKTLNRYRGYVRLHLDPLLGKVKVGAFCALRSTSTSIWNGLWRGCGGRSARMRTASGSSRRGA
jgi:hypothetical protein